MPLRQLNASELNAHSSSAQESTPVKKPQQQLGLAAAKSPDSLINALSQLALLSPERSMRALSDLTISNESTIEALVMDARMTCSLQPPSQKPRMKNSRTLDPEAAPFFAEASGPLRLLRGGFSFTSSEIRRLRQGTRVRVHETHLTDDGIWRCAVAMANSPSDDMSRVIGWMTMITKNGTENMRRCT